MLVLLELLELPAEKREFVLCKILLSIESVIIYSTFNLLPRTTKKM